ncbi:hypothetical protein C4900_13625 [Acidiferrobacter thiooxydans]|uniref:Sel1 repeat family protein n=2 Tax=Acidiferrobacter thiooxydans TaxID=163359 RepID=A0A368HED8_9GAMM|nr:hypothetical protein C4900_13625 [Acidiferrobacter thiooxydans]
MVAIFVFAPAVSSHAARAPSAGRILALAHKAAAGNQHALHVLRDFAHSDNPTADTILGILYVNGKGVPLDYAKAAYWYQKAAV